MTDEPHRPTDMSEAFITVCLRRLSQALEEPDALRRLGLLALAKADLAACFDHCLVAAHQAAGTMRVAKPAPSQLELREPDDIPPAAAWTS